MKLKRGVHTPIVAYCKLCPRENGTNNNGKTGTKGKIMGRGIILHVVLLVLSGSVAAQATFPVKGSVADASNRQAIELATVWIPELDRWATTDKEGRFTINNVTEGRYEVQCKVLGYRDTTFQVNVNDKLKFLDIALSPSSLALPEVEVTSKMGSRNLATTYNIDQTAIQHMQLLNVADVGSLLPGGKSSRNNTLNSASYIALRSKPGGESDNPTFGTGVEVDGLRLSTNSAFSQANALHTYGVDTRNIASSNVASVEVITGIPSVEYGDISNGVVKISTFQGKTPLRLLFSSNINSKQLAVSKGFALPKQHGILNMNIERVKSVSDIASPYTSYSRNSLSLKYSNTLNRENGRPLSLVVSLTGNVGGSNSANDPDAFRDTYSKRSDNTLRGGIQTTWRVNTAWLSNLAFSLSTVLSNNTSEQKTNASSPVSTASLHGKEEGYFVATHYAENPNAQILIVPRGYWYNTVYEENRPSDLRLELKGDLTKKVANWVYSKSKIGTQYVASGNGGRGIYYKDLSLAPTWREFRYSDEPVMHNTSFFAEEKLIVMIHSHKLEMIAGLRNDFTYIAKSEYGLISSLSPRFNIGFQSDYRNDRLFRRYSLHAGWGEMVKLPSFTILYPRPSYTDELTFAPGTLADGTTFYAYHTMPSQLIYNSGLRWQENQQLEVGISGTVGKTNISVSAFYNKTGNPYMQNAEYVPFSYKFTGQTALENSPIPSVNRRYRVDQESGIVSVVDKTGTIPTYQLDYKERTRFKGNYYYENGTPIHRVGLEWVIDFGKVKSLNSSVRVDGNLYHYKDAEDRMLPGTSGNRMSDGNHFKYLGFYPGGTSVSNASLSKECNTNLTLVTHIPSVRLVVSLRVECSLYSYSQRLSELHGERRGFVLDAKEDYFPSETKWDIYERDQFVGLYPDYYVSIDDMRTKIPFEEAFRWAKENDQVLYNDLARLVKKSNYKSTFNPARLTPFYSANINITKEIGESVSISFYAKNFLNNLAQVKSTENNRKQTLFNSSRIPAFYYGLTCRVKI
ncbi:MAG: TonB-dependent receptor [Fermentimonas sp.]